MIDIRGINSADCLVDKSLIEASCSAVAERLDFWNNLDCRIPEQNICSAVFPSYTQRCKVNKLVLYAIKIFSVFKGLFNPNL